MGVYCTCRCLVSRRCRSRWLFPQRQTCLVAANCHLCCPSYLAKTSEGCVTWETWWCLPLNKFQHVSTIRMCVWVSQVCVHLECNRTIFRHCKVLGWFVLTYPELVKEQFIFRVQLRRFQPEYQERVSQHNFSEPISGILMIFDASCNENALLPTRYSKEKAGQGPGRHNFFEIHNTSANSTCWCGETESPGDKHHWHLESHCNLQRFDWIA